MDGIRRDVLWGVLQVRLVGNVLVRGCSYRELITVHSNKVKPYWGPILKTITVLYPCLIICVQEYSRHLKF